MGSKQTAIGLEQSRNRLLAWEGCLNARDLGGYLTEDGRVTRWGAIIRSDSLFQLTPNGQKSLQAYGIRTVIDLRLSSEVEEAPNPFATPGDHDITYLHQSFISGPEVFYDPFTSVAEEYVSELGRNARSISQIMSLIAEARDGGVLFHCNVGRDRTGLIAAMLLALAGVPAEAIAEDYSLSSECLRQRNEEFLRSLELDREERERRLEKMKARPEVMRETLMRLARSYGSVEGYLGLIGCSQQDLVRLKIRLIEHSSLPSIT
jgi:protein-tyrosine phosphatase